jgi:hypothetical protein
LGYLLAKDYVHHHLEGCWQVGETKEHDHRFKEALYGEEGGFPLISIFNANIIVPPTDIEFGEQGASAEAIDGSGNKGGDIPILFGPFVNWTVILYWS